MKAAGVIESGNSERGVMIAAVMGSISVHLDHLEQLPDCPACTAPRFLVVCGQRCELWGPTLLP